MLIAINPGSGPVGNATADQAEANMRQFTADLTERGHENVVIERKADADYNTIDHDGRFCWTVSVDGEPAIEVQMPGIPLDQVRWLGRDQDIWQFPRLYVDDSSWIWFFALNQFRDDGYDAPDPNGTVVGATPA
jgi:hypothetical protein